jgi:hypothetical protein
MIAPSISPAEEHQEGDLACDEQAQTHRGVEDRTGVCRGDDTHEDREAPAPVDHEESAGVAFGALECDVGDDAAAEQQQHRCADDFREEVGSEIHDNHVVIDLSVRWYGAARSPRGAAHGSF